MNESLLPKERLALMSRVNDLPQSQFDALVYALSPPAGVVPGDSAPQGIRSAALLKWVESSGGRGLAAAQDLLEEILSKGAKPKSKPLSLSRHEELLGNGTSLEMVFIPGGRFIMGVPPDEPDNREEERPHHYVTVPSFYMGKYPVTQAEWRAVARLPKVSIELEPDPSYNKDAELPVEQVDWHDAVEFCQRLSAHSQRDYRLPSEAEWEYACRAGDTTPPHVRETLVSYMQTLGVDFYPPGNAFGLYDMQHGQGEWCQDTWHDNYQGAPNDGSAWREGGDPAYRVKRGGSRLKRYCSVYRRHRADPDDCYWDLGFRVCCSAP